ncbi:uncharacterized protein LOC120016233 [Tripterygium wilfordii]|uniref:uncharacterized protein LOC120016233 n=1 Tax=Tripterygium wilfordii TaxID=458696 RepID=UPI0018F82FF8|nr:uncharacterized protein LOC120016233 [Tripterygium wilfordii]
MHLAKDSISKNPSRPLFCTISPVLVQPANSLTSMLENLGTCIFKNGYNFHVLNALRYYIQNSMLDLIFPSTICLGFNFMCIIRVYSLQPSRLVSFSCFKYEQHLWQHSVRCEIHAHKNILKEI